MVCISINSKITLYLIKQTKNPVPTFVSFLRDIESPFEVKDYIRMYLGKIYIKPQRYQSFKKKKKQTHITSHLCEIKEILLHYDF